MSKSTAWLRGLFIEARLSAPPSVKRAVLPRLQGAYEIGRLIARPHLVVRELKGDGPGGPLTVTLINVNGLPRLYLEKMLFPGGPEESEMGRIACWKLGEVAGCASGDLVIVEVTRQLIRRLPREEGVVLPTYLHKIVNVTGGWESVLARCRHGVRENELRKLRKYGYRFEVSHSERDLEEYYDQMYLPTMQARHGRLASPDSRSLSHMYLKHGFLLKIKRESEWVAGALCHSDGETLAIPTVGVRDGNAELVKQAALSMAFYAPMQWANEHGCRTVNLLAAEPFLEGGMFQNKRRWGAAISVPRNLHRRLWIKVRRNTPAVAQFLKENPLIIMDEQGKLHGLIVVDDPQTVSEETRHMWQSRYETPGLDSLIVRSVASFGRPEDNGYAGSGPLKLWSDELRPLLPVETVTDQVSPPAVGGIENDQEKLAATLRKPQATKDQERA